MWRKYLLLCLTLMSVIILTLLTSCGMELSGEPSSALLERQLGIDDQYFSGLPTCEQIRMYSYLAPYFPGVHSIEARPFGDPSMTEIFYNKGQEVAPCVINEASKRLGNTKDPQNKWRVMALNILILNLQEDYISSRGQVGADFNYPEAQSYLHEVVCGSVAEPYQRDATQAYYISRYRSFPQDAEPTLGIEQMKNMLCK